jgi:dTMP kinase
MSRPFITIEGIDFTGKTSVIKALQDYDFGKPVVTTREPGGTPFAETMRNLMMVKPEPISEATLDMTVDLLLVMAGRVVHLNNFIIPHITNGSIVVTDRFVGSSFVYQGAILGTNVVINQYKLACGYLEAKYNYSRFQHNIVLQADYDTIQRRAQLRQAFNKFDTIPKLMYNRYANLYANLGSTLSEVDDSITSYIDANGSLDSVVQSVIHKIKEFL